MDTAQWPQEMVLKPMEEKGSIERKLARPQKEQVVNCPRCNSTNTKFCYYNNYSLTQPRYFCKTCRRYWTEGGSLRNIPVGGGSRKNKRSSSSSSPSPNSSSSSSKKLHLSNSINPNPNLNQFHESHDLHLGNNFPSTHDFKTISDLIRVPNYDTTTTTTTTTNGTKNQLSALELLTGITSKGLNNSFMPMPMSMPMPISDPNTIYSSGLISLPEFKPTLSFSLDGIGNGGANSGYGGVDCDDNINNGRLLFPFEDLKQGSTNNGVDHQNRDHQQGEDSAGYWNGTLAGGSWLASL